jgi:hypothetical protein
MFGILPVRKAEEKGFKKKAVVLHVSGMLVAPPGL